MENSSNIRARALTLALQPSLCSAVDALDAIDSPTAIEWAYRMHPDSIAKRVAAKCLLSLQDPTSILVSGNADSIEIALHALSITEAVELKNEISLARKVNVHQQLDERACNGLTRRQLEIIDWLISQERIHLQNQHPWLLCQVSLVHQSVYRLVLNVIDMSIDACCQCMLGQCTKQLNLNVELRKLEYMFGCLADPSQVLQLRRPTASMLLFCWKQRILLNIGEEDVYMRPWDLIFTRISLRIC